MARFIDAINTATGEVAATYTENNSAVASWSAPTIFPDLPEGDYSFVLRSDETAQTLTVGSPTTVTAAWLGQSEIHYLFATGPFWSNLGVVPLPSEPNLTVYPYTTSGLPDGIPVTTASVTAGDVSQSMGVLSAFLAHAAPGVQFVVGSAANSGTSRGALGDDSNTNRAWSSTANTIAAIERDYGKLDTLVECWFNADAARINNFRNNFWPLYFGVNGDGSPFTLGDNNLNGNAVDHSFWDALAPVDEKGRGVLARSETNWRILTPMPFWDAASTPDPEQVNFSENDGRLSEPSRAVMLALEGNAIAQSVNLEVGPSAHMTWFPTGNASHPNNQDPDGQILFMWPFAIAMLRQAGISVGEPTIVDVEGPETGEYVDLVVNLPNGGNLTTLRQFRDEPFPAERSPHQQEVTGFEVSRGGVRRPVFRESETSYDASIRGTVEIIDSGSGSPRRGRVRITPTESFESGNSVSYLRGQATAGLLTPRDRDNRLYMDMLMEHIPAFYNSAAQYPFEGIPVRPVQQELQIPVAVSAFAARGATFDGSTSYLSTSELVPAGQDGLVSLWFKNDDPNGWNGTESQRIFQHRVGTAVRMEMHVNNNGVLRLVLHTGANFNIGMRPPGGGDFETGRWYHVMVGWSGNNSYVAAIDGQVVDTGALGSMTVDGQSFTRVGVGGNSASGQFFIGSLAHLWLSVNQTLDLSDAAERAKFISSGAPVDLGGNGQLPTGIAPEWYYDGDAPNWTNRGTAGDIPLIGGPLTAAPLPIALPDP